MTDNSSSDNSSLIMDCNPSALNREDLLSDEAYLICGIYLTTLGIIAFIGNITVLIVLVVGRPNFMKLHTIMLFSISTSDLIIGCTAYPLTAVSMYERRWAFSEAACVMSGFVTYFFIMCNINSLCVMAICRYVIVCRPDLEPYLRGKNIRYIMACVWMYALFWTGSPLIGWSSYKMESFGTSCTVDWDGQTSADLSYNFLCIIFCYLLPLGIFLISYCSVAKSSVFSDRNVLRGTVPRPDSLSASELAVEEINRKAKIRASRHMTMVCFIMIIAFAVTWTPYAILTFCHLVSIRVSPEFQVLPTMFAKLNCIVNPFIYCLMCDRFREAAIKLFCCNNRIQPLSSVRRVVPRSEHNTRDITVLGLADISACPSRRESHRSDAHAVHLDTVDSSSHECFGSHGNSRSSSMFL